MGLKIQFKNALPHRFDRDPKKLTKFDNTARLITTPPLQEQASLWQLSPNLMIVKSMQRMTFTKKEYVPKLCFSNLNQPNTSIIDSDSLKTLLGEHTFSEDQITKHLTHISTFKEDDKKIIYHLYDSIFKSTLEEVQKNLLSEIISGTSCFVGLKNSLEQLSTSTSYPSQTTAPFEQWLNIQIKSYIDTVILKIVSDINKHVFFNAEDPQSTHQKEPVTKYLDKHFKLYQGNYPDDIHNSLTPYAESWIKKSIDRLNNASPTDGIFNLASWEKAVIDQLNLERKSPGSQLPCCAPYLSQLSQNENISDNFKNLCSKLVSQIVDMEDLDKKYLIKLNNKYFPTDYLIKDILKNKLIADVPQKINNDQISTTQSNAVFCLRNGIKEQVIRTAHDIKDTIATTLNNESKNWDISEIILFLHIIFNRFNSDNLSLNEKLTSEIKLQLITRTDFDGYTILQLAAKNGQTKTVKALIDLGANSKASNNGWTALHIAAEKGHTETVQILLESGADFEAKDDKKWTALHFAAKNGHAKTVEILTQAENANLEVTNDDGWTALHIAAQGGHTDTVEILTQAENANLEVTNNNGWTALQIAAYYNHTETVNVLIKFGAKLDAKNNNGSTALHIAAKNGHAKTVEILAKALIELRADLEAKNIYEKTALHFAAEKGYTEIVEILANLGADLEAKDDKKWTALHLAAEKGHTETVNALIKFGTKLDEKNIDGWTALHFAAMNSQTETVKALIEFGAKLDAKNIDGWTALQIAAQNGHTETLKALIELRADLEAKVDKEWTALHIAAQNGHTETIKALIELRADLEAKNIYGWTALHIAARNGHTDTVEALIAAKAKLDAKNIDGWTALHIAALKGYSETVKILAKALIDLGSDLDAKNNDGNTALQIAIKYYHQDVVNVLKECGAKDPSYCTIS